jgi:integrating conjugative element protein (TIGR03756 family)
MKTSLIVGMACLIMNGLAFAQVTGSGSSTSSTANEVTSTTELYVQATASFPSCSQWHVSGTCFFLHCSIKCRIRTSVRYSHFAPDLVVSTYQDLDNHPWPEIGIPIGKMMLQGASLIQKGFIGDGAGTMTKSSRRDMNAKYRDADAIGHPGGAISSCPSAATTFMPYFSSFTDASAWRNFLPADMWQLASWVPGLREIGSFPLNTWGNVMPRTGWHTHQHDVKVAAVLSQRVADIVTQTGQPHVYDYLSSNTFTVRDGDMVWDPPSAKENSEMGGLWQLSAPKSAGSAAQCHVFGDNDSVSPVGYGDHSTSKTQSYAYTLWRPYACCRKRGIFLYAIIWGKW